MHEYNTAKKTEVNFYNTYNLFKCSAVKYTTQLQSFLVTFDLGIWWFKLSSLSPLFIVTLTLDSEYKHTLLSSELIVEAILK